MPTEQEYWEAMRTHVCVRCDDGDGRGNCRLVNTQPCPLKSYFPEILGVVNSVYSHSIEPYEELLHKRVCAICVHPSAHGSCSLRDAARCPLDRSFPVVVQVIEGTQFRFRISRF
jgi:hypothetical protein